MWAGQCERFEGQCAAWWPEVRREASVMSEAVIWMSASLTAPVAPTLFATDARGAIEQPPWDDCGAYAIVASDGGEELALQCISTGMSQGFSVIRLDGTFTGARRP